MKRTFSYILVLGFMGVAVFGFAAMDHGMDHGGCFVSFMNTNPCADQMDAMSNFVSHLDVFKSFTVGVFSSVNALMLLASLVVFAMAALSWKLFAPPAVPLRVASPPPAFIENVSHAQKRALRWTALHEHSPTR